MSIKLEYVILQAINRVFKQNTINTFQSTCIELNVTHLECLDAIWGVITIVRDIVMYNFIALYTIDTIGLH